MDVATLEHQLADAFAQIDPDITVVVGAASPRPDHFFVRIQDTPVTLQWLNRGWPRQVRDLLMQHGRPDVVASSELSPGAQELLTEESVSWIDGTGAARISLPGLYIRSLRSQAPRPRSFPGWSPATLAVCEALLIGVGGTVAEVASATGLANSTVAGALRFLQDSQLLESEAERGRYSRRRLSDSQRLLDNYAAAAAKLRSRSSIRAGVLWRDPIRGAAELGEHLTNRGIAWTATSAIAADVLAPYLTEVAPWELYVSAGSTASLRHVAREVNLTETEGGRLVLRPFPTPAVDSLCSTVGQLRIPPWPRVFADLRMSGVRGEEAAEHLRDLMGSAS